MYARSTTLMTDPASVSHGIAMVREEVLPAIRDTDGCVGLSLVVDRESGKAITTTAWESHEALVSSRELAGPLRRRMVELMGASEPLVEDWEIASMHRAHDAHSGTCVRAAWSRVSPGQVGRALEFYRESLLPHVERLEGFVSASLLLDRSTGRGVTSVAFESRQAMEGTRDEADYLRARSTQEAQVEFLDVGEFDLALGHLRVPELV